MKPDYSRQSSRRCAWDCVLESGARCSGSSSAPAPSRSAVPRDALPSWNDGPSKKALTSFVSRVTTEGSPDFVPAAERIAVFDNDGTLWAEQPMYFQLAFALDRVKALAPQHPEWQTRSPSRACSPAT